MMHRMTFALALVSLGGCVSEGPQEWWEEASERGAIVGGEPSDAEDYPAVGAFWGLYSNSYGQTKRALQCTGTLIAPDTVLTAAHCTFAPPNSGVASMDLYFTFTLDINEYTGDGPGDPPPLSTHVKQLIYHRDFDLESMMGGGGGMGPYGLGDYYDIGLAFLDEPVIDREPAVVLQPESDVVGDGMEVAIVGYGQQTAESSPMGPEPEAGVQHEATTWVSEVGGTEIQVGDATVPATNPNKCHGDSGGPSFADADDDMVPNTRIVGITSRAYDTMADCAMGGVDTRADAFHDWIDMVMQWACEEEIRTDCIDGGALPLPSGTGPEDPSDAGPDGSDPVEPEDDAGPEDTGPDDVVDADEPVEPEDDAGDADAGVDNPDSGVHTDAGFQDDDESICACGCGSCSVSATAGRSNPGPSVLFPVLFVLISLLFFRRG